MITGPDVNHIKNVLRMKPGEQILLSDGKGTNCLCEIAEIESSRVLARILPELVEDTELPVEVTLYQGLPKGDKMEFIIQKCVELGVSRIVPVEMARSVVKLDKKKEEAKRKRWQGISESAAKQSKRMIVPEIGPVLSYKEAVAEAASMDLFLLPYEDSESLSGAGGMELTRSPDRRTGAGKEMRGAHRSRGRLFRWGSGGCQKRRGQDCDPGKADLKDRDGGAFCAFSRGASFGGLIFKWKTEKKYILTIQPRPGSLTVSGT